MWEGANIAAYQAAVCHGVEEVLTKQAGSASAAAAAFAGPLLSICRSITMKGLYGPFCRVVPQSCLQLSLVRSQRQDNSDDELPGRRSIERALSGL